MKPASFGKAELSKPTSSARRSKYTLGAAPSASVRYSTPRMSLNARRAEPGTGIKYWMRA